MKANNAAFQIERRSPKNRQLQLSMPAREQCSYLTVSVASFDISQLSISVPAAPHAGPTQSLYTKGS